jgi:hypothetical protein
LTTKQRDGESLQDYTQRYKTACEIFESHIGGPLSLTKYVTTIKGYDSEDKDKENELVQRASEQFYAYVYLDNADRNKYSNMIKNLNHPKLLNNNQFPKTIVETTSVLSNHPFDYTARQYKSSKNNNQQTGNDEKGPTLSFVQLDGKCYCCGKPGHKSPDCKSKNKIPCKEWAINKTQLTQSTVQLKLTHGKSEASLLTTQTKTPTNKDNNKNTGWAGIHCSFAQSNNMKNLILLDSDSTDTVFCNPNYVTNIRDADATLELGTNGGPMTLTKSCDIPLLGTVWFNEKSISNIISLADMTKKFRVTMDLLKDKALLVHLPDKVVCFKEMKNGLYALNPNNKQNYISNKKVQLVNTIKGNFKLFDTSTTNASKEGKKAVSGIGDTNGRQPQGNDPNEFDLE